jgi:hypothetical protein
MFRFRSEMSNGEKKGYPASTSRIMVRLRRGRDVRELDGRKLSSDLIHQHQDFARVADTLPRGSGIGTWLFARPKTPMHS